ncbi:MAG: hypothetical protein AB7K68_07160 [Bacteriovoracia bacterium]
MSNPKHLILFALALSLGASTTFAAEGGSESGGGENSVVCFADPTIPAAIRNPQSPRFGQILDAETTGGIITSVEAYDLYEARMPRGLDRMAPSIIGIGANEGVRAYSEKIAQRFAPFIPAAANLIRNGSAVFSDDKIIMRPAGLKRVHDENDVGYIDASRCVVATMATQYRTGSEDQLQIDSRLFNHPSHSRLSGAVLFLHELVYHTARLEQEQRDSRATRALVSSLINSTPIDSVAFLERMKKLGFSYGDGDANTFARMTADLTSNEEANFKKYIEDAAKENNLAFVKRYNQWQTKYGPHSIKAKISKDGFFFPERGPTLVDKSTWMYSELQRFFPGAFFPSSGEDDITRTVREECSGRPAGCEPVLKSLVKDVLASKDRLTRLARTYWLKTMNEKLYPELDKLAQFDAEAKAKAKEIITDAIAHGKIHEESFASNVGITFTIDGEHTIYPRLAKIRFLIP